MDGKMSERVRGGEGERGDSKLLLGWKVKAELKDRVLGLEERRQRPLVRGREVVLERHTTQSNEGSRKRLCSFCFSSLQRRLSQRQGVDSPCPPGERAPEDKERQAA